MWLRLITLSCLLSVLFGCTADDPTRHNTFIPLTSIEVTGTYETMADQTVNQYRAIGDFSGEFTRDITTEVSWTIGNSDVATVSNVAESQGLVTALSPGETSITAIYGEISGSAPVVVTNAYLTGIAITPEDDELQVDMTGQYQASGMFSDESVQDITMLVTWESSDTDVAAIDDAGLASARATGITTISGTWQGIESSTSLLVTGAALTAITITPEEAAIAKGTTVQFLAEGTYSDDTVLDITDIVDWQSSANGIGTVDAAGLATGVAPGEAEVSASYVADGDTISATAVLTVTGAVIQAISISPGNSRITAGSSQQFTATGRFSDGSEQDITELASWFSSNDTVGTISNSPGSRGLFVSTEPGVTLIEATFDDIGGETELTVE